MIYDFNVPFTDLSGKENGKTLAEAFQEFIGSQAGKREDTIKGLHWYGEIKKGGTLDLDELSKKQLVEIIYNSEILFLYVKEQYLKILEPAKTE